MEGLASSHSITYSGYDQAGNVTQYRMDMYEGTSLRRDFVLLRTPGSKGLGGTETHIKDFMMRHQNMLGLSTEDARIQKYCEIMEFNVPISIAVRDMFFLSTGIAILACDKLENSDYLLGNGVTILLLIKEGKSWKE